MLTRLDREDWIDAAAAALVEHGIEGVAVEPLARALGVTKGSYYWHFKKRSDLLVAVLDRWEQQGTSAVIDTVDQAAGHPRERLRELTRLALPADADASSHRLESALRAWATSDDRAAAVMARVDEVRLRYVRDLLVAAGVDGTAATHRAQLLYRVIIGESLYRSTNNPALRPAAVEELLTLVTSVDARPHD